MRGVIGMNILPNYQHDLFCTLLKDKPGENWCMCSVNGDNSSIQLWEIPHLGMSINLFLQTTPPMHGFVCSRDSHPKENNCRNLFFFLRLYGQNFPSEIRRDCDDECCQEQSPIPAFNIKCLSQTLLLTGDTDTRKGPFHNYFQSFFFYITLLWLGKQPVSTSLFLQSWLDSHKANINHINDIVHHWNVNLQANNSDSMDYFGPGFWIWNDLSLSEKNWHCPI